MRYDSKILNAVLLLLVLLCHSGDISANSEPSSKKTPTTQAAAPAELPPRPFHIRHLNSLTEKQRSQIEAIYKKHQVNEIRNEIEKIAQAAGLPKKPPGEHGPGMGGPGMAGPEMIGPGTGPRGPGMGASRRQIPQGPSETVMDMGPRGPGMGASRLNTPQGPSGTVMDMGPRGPGMGASQWGQSGPGFDMSMRGARRPKRDRQPAPGAASGTSLEPSPQQEKAIAQIEPLRQKLESAWKSAWLEIKPLLSESQIKELSSRSPAMRPLAPGARPGSQ